MRYLFHATAKECSGSAVRFRHCPATVMRAPARSRPRVDCKVKLARRLPLIVQWTSGRDELCKTRADFEIAPVRRPVLLLLYLPRFRRGSGGDDDAIFSGPNCGQTDRCARGLTRRVALALLGFLLSTCAEAVVVRGRVTDALGKPVPGGMVRLVEDGKVVAIAYADQKGEFEIRSADAGQVYAAGFSSVDIFRRSVWISMAARPMCCRQDVVLAANTVRQDITVSATGIPTPLPQLTSPVSVIPGESA